MIKTISNIKSIKEQLAIVTLPDTFTLSKAEIITDVNKFIDSYLTIIDTPRLTKFHRPYYERLKKLMDTLNIEIIIIEKN